MWQGSESPDSHDAVSQMSATSGLGTVLRVCRGEHCPPHMLLLLMLVVGFICSPSHFSSKPQGHPHQEHRPYLKPKVDSKHFCG